MIKKSMFTFSIAVLLSFGLASCGSDPSDSTPVAPLDIQRSEQLYSSFKEPFPDLIRNKLTKMVINPGFKKGNFIIDNSSQWSDFWADYLQAAGLSLPLPDVDFASTTVFVTQRESRCSSLDLIKSIVQIYSKDRSQTYVQVVRNTFQNDNFVSDCGNPVVGYWTVHAVPLPNASITRDIHFEEVEEELIMISPVIVGPTVSLGVD